MCVAGESVGEDQIFVEREAIAEAIRSGDRERAGQKSTTSIPQPASGATMIRAAPHNSNTR